MIQVMLHTWNPGKWDWHIEFREFGQIPHVGEYVTLHSTSEWYKVELVVHTPFEGADCMAEAYAVSVDYIEEKRRAFGPME
jgi:hypothetical protein